MNTQQPNTDPKVYPIEHHDTYVSASITLTSGGITKLKVKLYNGSHGLFYKPIGSLTGVDGLKLYPMPKVEDGVFKLSTDKFLLLPGRFYDGQQLNPPIKKLARIIALKEHDGLIRIPKTILEGREKRMVRQTSQHIKVGKSIPASTARLEGQFTTAVRFINEHRKDARARLVINASGDLLATLTKTITVK